MRYFSESDLDIFYGTDGSAGIDLPFYVPEIDQVTINPGESFQLKTGVYLEIPEGNVGILDSRSSTSKLKLDLLAHTIDSDFRGNIRVVVINNGTKPVTVFKGDYLAQIVIVPFYKANLARVNSVEDLSQTERGTGSFGHTGNATHNNKELGNERDNKGKFVKTSKIKGGIK